MNIPKLTNKLIGLLYWCVLECMSRVDRNTPPDRADGLQELEIIISNLIDKQ